MDTVNILLTGVGGQGILLAARVVAAAAETAGFDVAANEIHGMAQRGGAVSAQIRYGVEVHSPLMVQGEADVLGALEPVEALRWSSWLRPDALAAVSDSRVIPVTVSTGSAVYPADLETRLRATFKRLIYLPCDRLAEEKFGNLKTANLILLGALSNGLALPATVWPDAIRSCIKAKYADLNLQAFEFGRNFQP